MHIAYTNLHNFSWLDIETSPDITIYKIVSQARHSWSTSLILSAFVTAVLVNDGFPPKWYIIDFERFCCVGSGAVQGCNLVFQLCIVKKIVKFNF